MLIHITRSLLSLMYQREGDTTEAAIVQRVNQASKTWQWHAHNFPYGRSNCVMVCHDESGYVLVLPGLPTDDYACFVDAIKDVLSGSIEELGFTSAEAHKLLLATGAVSVDDQCNNTVKEMLSVAWQDLHNFLHDRPDLSMWNPLRLGELINQRIIKKEGEWRRPDELFSQWVTEQLKQLP